MRSGESMAVSIICLACYLDLPGAREPPDFLRLGGTQYRRVGPRFASPIAAASASAKLSFSSGPRKRAIASSAPARDQEQPLDAELLVRLAIELHPERVERPFATRPRCVTLRT